MALRQAAAAGTGQARPMEIDGAVILVTGASRGIGRAIAELLARRGARVVCAGRDRAALAAIAAVVGGTPLVADLREVEAADRLVQQARAAYGRLDAVVAAAGIGHVGPVAEMTAEQVAALVDVNVRATFLLARAAVAAFADQAAAGDRRQRALCVVGSIAGAVGVPGESVYSATKAAVQSLAALLGEELRGAGVAVSTVLPGVVDTEVLARRGQAYDRRFPRPMPAARAAGAVVTALERGTPRRIEPRWLAVPARLAGAAPALYRALARRLS